MYKLISTTLLVLSYSFQLLLNPLGNNDQYFLSTNITIGLRPEQPITFVGIDTGASQLWVPSLYCIVNRKSKCSGNLFNPQLSKTYKKIDNIFDITYDDGTSFQGIYSSDIITIGNHDIGNYVFGLVDKAKYYQDETLYNRAVLGIAPKSTNEIGSSLLDMWFSGVDKFFSLYLPRNIEHNGIMSFGYNINKYYIIDSNVTISVSLKEETWYVSSINVANINGVIQGKTYSGILDTGSDMMYLPKDMFNKICNLIGWRVKGKVCIGDCSSIKNLTNFILMLNGQRLIIDLQNYFTYKIDNNCVLAIIPSKDEYGITIGMSILRQYYTVWNFETSEVTFFTLI